MNATIPMLLVSIVVTAFAPQSAAQEPNQPKVSSRRPVDVSVEGLGEAARRAPGDIPGVGSTGFSARRTTESTLPLDCIARIADQATGGCLTASSTPTLGMLYPYPGLNNSFVLQAFVGGGENNQATEPWSTVGGGYRNIASGYYSSLVYGRATVAGGDFNTASGFRSTIGGGGLNSASGKSSTIGGGAVNFAGPGLFSGSGDYSTVGGGIFNSASGNYATVVGGSVNSASGVRSTVGGGSSNSASGDFSFAAGRQAKADHDGAFVWGDSQIGDKSSSTFNQFNVYCSGGARFFTNSAATSGVLLAAGGSTWTMVSDRDAKENVEAVDARAVLGKVAQLPLATWNYKAQDDSIRHMGPMAQDFYAAFGLGLGNKTIDTIDPNGVALAAIQGLNEVVGDENANLKERLAEKDAQIEALLARVERLEALARAAMAK